MISVLTLFYTLFLSDHLRFLLWWLVIAYIVLIALGALWCMAYMCCVVPRRLRYCIGSLCCVELFITLALTAYVASTAHFEHRDAQLFGL